MGRIYSLKWAKELSWGYARIESAAKRASSKGNGRTHEASDGRRIEGAILATEGAGSHVVVVALGC
jgi:hypothetical protein